MATYSATEVIAELDGKLSYRQLDYWCRYGAVVLAEDADGSGTRRRFTEIELAALHKLVARYNAINQQLEDIRDGKTWTEILRRVEFDQMVAAIGPNVVSYPVHSL